MSRYTIPHEPEPGIAEHITAQLRRIEDPGARVATITELLRWLETLETFSVAEMRQSGSSWAEIGQALDVTREAAWAHYGKPERVNGKDPGQETLL